MVSKSRQMNDFNFGYLSIVAQVAVEKAFS